MFRNSQNQWGSVAKSLHWWAVILILAEVPAGFLMSHTYGLSMRDTRDGLPLHNFAGQMHHTIGFAILLLACIRLGWRFSGSVPSRSLASGIVHAGLYALLIALPLSGWAALSVYGEAPIWFFNRSDWMPAILPRVPVRDPHGYGFYARIHIRLLLIGAALLTLHVAAAFWHHYRRRDGVLLRMWPLAVPQDELP